MKRFTQKRANCSPASASTPFAPIISNRPHFILLRPLERPITIPTPPYTEIQSQNEDEDEVCSKVTHLIKDSYSGFNEGAQGESSVSTEGWFCPWELKF